MRTCLQKPTPHIVLLLLILAATFCGAESAIPPGVHLGTTATSVSVGKELQYVVSTRQESTITDILSNERGLEWKTPQKFPLFLGNAIQTVWVRFRLHAPPEASENSVLEITWPYFDLLELYTVHRQNDRIEKITKGVPQHGYLPFAFRLSMKQDAEEEVYIKVHNTGKLLLPLRILPEPLYVKNAFIRYMQLGILFGILVVMCLYNMFLSIFTRDSSYTWYVVYVFSIILYTLDNTGVGQTFIWPGSSYIQTHSFGLFSSFSFLAAALFIRRFLNLPKQGGWLLHLSNVVIAFWIVIFTLYLVSNHHWILDVADFGAIFSCIAGLVTSIILWIRGSISAKYLTIAWTILILATLLLMLGLTGFLPFLPVVQNSQNVGFIIEVVLLSIALAERINRARLAEKAAQLKILTMEREANLLLEKRVAQRTIDLNRAMDTLKLANKELGALSLQDELTQLSNRRHFNIVFDREFKRAIRYKQPLAIILIDLDHFKNINDNFGHQTGDLCLQHIARILRSQAARAEDFVARYGGEEFIIILPGVSIDTAVKTAERMRMNIESHPFHSGERKHTITASFGVAGLPSKSHHNQKSLLRGADKALYRAKANGRNRTEAIR